MRSARMRDIASDGPPAANGTIMVSGLAGKTCASAPTILAASAAMTTARNFVIRLSSCVTGLRVPDAVQRERAISVAATYTLPQWRASGAPLIRDRYGIGAFGGPGSAAQRGSTPSEDRKRVAAPRCARDTPIGQS